MKKTTHSVVLAVLLAAAFSVGAVQALESHGRHFKLPKSQTVRQSGKVLTDVRKPFNDTFNNNTKRKGAPVYTDGEVTLYGDVIYSDAWEETSDYGVYAVNAATGAMKAVSPTGDTNFKATGGAVYKDGHYYMISGDEYSATWYDYSTSTWDEENESEEDPTWLATDMTASPADGKIYAAMADGNGGQELTAVNFDEGSRTVIGKLNTNIVTLSSDAYGTLYAIGDDGRLYTVDTATGSEKAIGYTGISPEGMQSATFDFKSGRLYWAASTADGTGALYTVDTGTGKAAKVADFSGNEQIVGLYSLSEAQKWQGPDVPAAPLNVTATAGGSGDVTISWQAPEGGLHNGDYDPAGTTYSVMRLPDSVIVGSGISGTTLTYHFAPEELRAYTYAVTAANAAGNGGTAKSNAVAAGSSVSLPYTADFGYEPGFILFARNDADGDGTTWQLSAAQRYAMCPGAPFEYTSDWLYAPVMHLESGRLYLLKATAGAAFGANYPYHIKAAAGKQAEPSDDDIEIIADTVFGDNDNHTLNAYFKVNETGSYHIGFNASGDNIQNVVLSALSVEEGPEFSAPDSVKALSVTADAAGKPTVSVSFRAPEQTVDGRKLAGNMQISIYRDGKLIKTVSGITPGQTLTVQDTEAVSGRFNTYRIVASADGGEGLPAEAAVYVGIDTPLPPASVHAAYDGSGKVRLTWTAPAGGANGGTINPRLLTYAIQRAAGDAQPQVLTASCIGNAYSDNISEEGPQTYQIYGITARNSAGTSSVATSNTLIKGAPYTLPFRETLTNGESKYFWLSSTQPEGSSAAWGVGSDYESGRNFFQYSASYRAGDDAAITSGKISLTGADNPVLEFDYWYRAEEGDDSLRVYLIENGTDSTLIATKPYTRYQDSRDFETVAIPLKKYVKAGTRFVQVAFALRTYSSDALPAAAVRDVTVRDRRSDDLAAQGITVPAKATAGDTIAISGSVLNYGSNNADAYTVTLLENGREAAQLTQGTLAAGQSRSFSFRVAVPALKDKLTFSYRIDYAKDKVAANNTSDTASTAVTLPVYPVPVNATAVSDGGSTTLQWSAPEYKDFAVPVTDGAENYAAFADSNLGGWTLRDGDGHNTRSDIQVEYTDINYTHKGEPMSWMVMNPTEAGAPLTNWMDAPTGWQPASGKQYFASISSADGTNDDWLISPELSGDAQTVSFFQHGYYGMEQYEVLYSLTDTAESSFISLGRQQSSAEWTRAEFELPEGARYFAIRNLGGESSSYFFVDDITYSPLSKKGALSLTGYNIYRNGLLTATTDAATRHYSAAAGSSDDEWQITAVYNLGESAAATAVVTTGIEAAEYGNGSLSVSGSRIACNGTISIYTADGRLLFRGRAAGGISLQNGLYIIRYAGKADKVIIRQ